MKEEVGKKRIAELDIAKGIAVLGVLLIHIEMVYHLMDYGVAFHIVTFFAVSGILNDKEDFILKDEIKKKAKALLIPYLALSGLYIVVFGIVELISTRTFPLSFILINLYLTASGSGLGSLWFLPAMFLGTVIFFCAKKFLGKSHGPVLIILMAAFVFAGRFLSDAGAFGEIHYTATGIITNELQLLFKGFIAAGFMALGPYIWKGLDFLEEKTKKWIYYASGICIIAAALWLYIFYDGSDLHFVYIINAWGFVLATVSGTAAVLFVSRMLAKIPVITDIFQFFGRNSLIIMTTNAEYRVIYFVPVLIEQLKIALVFRKIFVYVLVCLIEVLICLVVNKTPLKYLYRPKLK